MIEDYKSFAKELYRTKLTVVGQKPDADNLFKMQLYLAQLNNLRPRLREELNHLAKEFNESSPKISIQQMDEVNNFYISKLQTYCRQVARQIKKTA